MTTEASTTKAKSSGLREEIVGLWASLPDKPLFFILLAAWLALFQLLGNSTFGYKDTPSLFSWLNYVYSMGEDDEHGRLIPIVVLVLLILKRKELTEIPKAPWWPALLLLVAGLLLHIAGYVIQQTRVSVVGFFAGLYGLTGLIWGRRWMAATFFPYFLFVFCLPLGGTLAEKITVPLRHRARARHRGDQEWDADPGSRRIQFRRGAGVQRDSESHGTDGFDDHLRVPDVQVGLEAGADGAHRRAACRHWQCGANHRGYRHGGSLWRKGRPQVS
jgi:hypothetical protein